MQLSIAFSLHFGWGSQLNTSEMFWIDISRWMISSRCSWISVYLFWRTAHAFEPRPFFVALLALQCVFNPVNCPAVIYLPRIEVFIVFWERDITSEHHGTPVHILITVYTLIYFSAFTFSCYYHYHYPLCFLSFVNNKTGEIDNLSELHWEQSYLCLSACPGEVSN